MDFLPNEGSKGHYDFLSFPLPVSAIRYEEKLIRLNP